MKKPKQRPLLLSILAWVAALSPVAMAQHGAGGNEASSSSAPERSAPWDPAVVDLFRSLPVQDGGRIKPLDSLAGLRLLTLNGKRTLKLEDGTKLSAMEWLLDCFFYPEQTLAYPCFRVQFGAVITGIGLEPKAKRDWYSYHDLESGLSRLMRSASEYADIESKDQSALEQQTLKLAMDVRAFEGLISFLAPMRATFETHASPGLAQIFEGDTEGSLVSVLNHAQELAAYARSMDPEEAQADQPLQRLFMDMGNAVGQGGLAVLPPPAEAEDQDTWWSVVDVAEAAFTPHGHVEKQLELMGALGRMARDPGDSAAFRSELERLHAGVTGLAASRGAYSGVPLEVKLNRFDPFTNALVLYLLAYLLTGVGWLVPGKRWLWRGVWGCTIAGTALAVTGITMRCIIRDRPPVVSLYDTILFITSSIVIVTMFMEYFSRQRMMLSLGALLGAAGMFLAGRYELKEVATAGDTMASVVAVLDTNYYLAIHVTTVTLGYAGGLLASGIAHVWLLGKLVGYRRGDKAFYKSIIRMVYGVICFSLLFAIFGTIMGGVWANDSWGRFWGWDPKENGALLIVIWHLMVLHGRMGGYLRDRGIAVCAVLGGVVVSMSWWGVNLLGVGLHSYGFTSGVVLILVGAWAIEGLVLLVSGAHALGGRARA